MQKDGTCIGQDNLLKAQKVNETLLFTAIEEELSKALLDIYAVLNPRVINHRKQ